jgi:hypothetical protein
MDQHSANPLVNLQKKSSLYHYLAVVSIETQAPSIMNNKVFYVQYLNYFAVKIETHYKGDEERRRPLADISDLLEG